MVLQAGGCGSAQKEGSGERSALSFTVVDPEKVPQELAGIIEENKKNEIRMTYRDGDVMYLVRGYGEQETGGCSITVDECSEDEEQIYLDTTLLGPKEANASSKEHSFPYLVVKIETREKEVVIS
jgi:hypothetical protein